MRSSRRMQGVAAELPAGISMGGCPADKVEARSLHASYFNLCAANAFFLFGEAQTCELAYSALVFCCDRLIWMTRRMGGAGRGSASLSSQRTAPSSHRSHSDLSGEPLGLTPHSLRFTQMGPRCVHDDVCSMASSLFAAPCHRTTVWDVGSLHRGAFAHRYWSSKGCLYHHAYPIGYRASKARTLRFPPES